MRFILERPVLSLTILGLLLFLLGQPPAGSDFFTDWGSHLTVVGGMLAILPIGTSFALRHVLTDTTWRMAIGMVLGLAMAMGLDVLLCRWRAPRA
jgi:hypothetical protein